MSLKIEKNIRPAPKLNPICEIKREPPKNPLKTSSLPITTTLFLSSRVPIVMQYRTETGCICDPTESNEKKCEVDGIKWSGSLRYYSNGKVRQGITCYAHTFGALGLCAGVGILFFENGSINFVNGNGNCINYAGLQFKKVVFYSNGKPQFGELQFDCEYMEIGFMADTKIFLRENGNIGKGTLSKDKVINGIKLERGDDVHFNKDGSFNSFVLRSGKTRVEINGLPCKTSGYQYFSHVKRVQKAVLSEKCGYAGWTLKSDTEVEFFENGKVKSAILGRDRTFNGTEYKEGERLNFTEEGTFIQQGKKDINGFPIDVSKQVERYEDGKLKSAVLAKDHTYNGIDLTKGTRITFNSDGHLILPGDMLVQRVPCKGGHPVEFHKNGKLGKAFLYRDFQIPHTNIWIKSDTEIGFFDNENLAYGIPSQPAVILIKRGRKTDRIQCKSGQSFQFNYNGTLKLCFLHSKTTIAGIGFKKDQKIFLDDKGFPNFENMKGSITIDKYPVNINRSFERYPNGKLKFFTPAKKSITIKGIPFKGEDPKL